MKVEIITSSADPDHGGFGGRVHGLISMFSQFADVRVVLTSWLGGPRVPGVAYDALPIRDSLDVRLRRLRSYYRVDFPRRNSPDPPGLVVVESPDLLGLNQYGPGVPWIFDEHNVYWNLLRYELPNTPFFRGWLGRRRAVRRWLIPRLLDRAKRFEVRAIRESSRTFVTSEVDRRAILAECPDAWDKVKVLPNCVDVSRMPPLPDPVGSRNVVFVGDFNYVPNREAATFVSRELAPELPDARFLLVGANPPREAVGPNVEALGRVPDLLGILRDAAVCIAPLQQGSGTRIKILTYLAAARAVVATAKACEGLDVRDGRDLLIRDGKEEFGQAVRQLLDEPETRRGLGAAGRTLVESAFDWRVHVDWLRRVADEIRAEAGS